MGFLAENWILFSSILMFAVVYLYGYFNVFNKVWKGRARYEAASCGISMVHGSVAAVLACYEIFGGNDRQLDAPNTHFQNGIMEFSMAYFIVDLIYYFVTASDDYLFIVHHFATLTYMFSCHYFTHHGAFSVMYLIAAGELTSPVQNIWTLARMARGESPTAKKIYTNLSPFFTLYFTVVRGIFGPYLTWKLGAFYLTGQADAVVPRWLAYCWMVKVAIGIFGSVVWVYKLWVGLLKFYSKKGAKRSSVTGTPEQLKTD